MNRGHPVWFACINGRFAKVLSTLATCLVPESFHDGTHRGTQSGCRFRALPPTAAAEGAEHVRRAEIMGVERRSGGSRTPACRRQPLSSLKFNPMSHPFAYFRGDHRYRANESYSQTHGTCNDSRLHVERSISFCFSAWSLLVQVALSDSHISGVRFECFQPSQVF